MAVIRPSAFRGRARERERLDRLLQAARTGRSGVLVIRGEAGVGKTALLRHAARQAAGFRVVEIAGVEAEMELAFAGLHQLCLPLLDRLELLPEPQHNALRIAFGMTSGPPPDRFLVALATLSLLSEAGAERPLLCLVDDVQWLDDASAQVLGFVARRLLADHVALLFIQREPSAKPALGNLPELPLRGLEDEDARALLASIIPGRLDERVRDRIVAETRGNPLALLELSQRIPAGELAGGFALPDIRSVPAQIEDRYRQRISLLPEPTRRLMLVGAADPVGDAALVWRAAETLDIGRDAVAPAQAENLLEIDMRVQFHHPLVRSAVYRAASAEDRQTAHGALAAATDPETDPDRRCWHRAHATTPPDEAVAGELIDCAQGAERRGGIAASAAFLERAVLFTPDPTARAARALAAAEAKFAAGDFPATESLLAIADIGPLDELAQVQIELTRALIAFDVSRGSDAPAHLLRAAERLEQLDPMLARGTYLEALIAAIYVGGLASDVDTPAVARAARSTQLGADSVQARKQVVLGLTTRFIDGYAAAAPELADALRGYLGEQRRLDWVSVAYTLVAMELWDDEAWLELASSHADFARATGTLVFLPYALDYLAGYYVHAGELSRVAELMAESEALQMGIKRWSLPYLPLRLAALRGDVPAATGLFEQMINGAHERVEGAAVASAYHAMAMLYNGLGRYEQALDAAQRAAAAGEIVTSSWALSELVEAAARSGRTEVACEAAERLSERTCASGTAWARGTDARSRALVANGDAEALHREAIELLGRCRMATHLARAHLSYGEWLRREHRRTDAREQLRRAHDMFVVMGADGFAGRARHELLATGERVRRRSDDTRDELTPQEEHIARLARDGRTNPEIGAELFLSPRTVEWHLRKVFTKLAISSRKNLDGALAARERQSAARAERRLESV